MYERVSGHLEAQISAHHGLSIGLFCHVVRVARVRLVSETLDRIKTKPCSRVTLLRLLLASLMHQTRHLVGILCADKFVIGQSGLPLGMLDGWHTGRRCLEFASLQVFNSESFDIDRTLFR